MPKETALSIVKALEKLASKDYVCPPTVRMASSFKIAAEAEARIDLAKKTLALLRPAVCGEPMEILGANGQKVVVLEYGRGPFEVDFEIAKIVKALNDGGVSTVASCSGHGWRPGNIILRDGRELFIIKNFEEARELDKNWPFTINGETVLEQIQRLSQDAPGEPKVLCPICSHDKNESTQCEACGRNMGPDDKYVGTGEATQVNRGFQTGVVLGIQEMGPLEAKGVERPERYTEKDAKRLAPTSFWPHIRALYAYIDKLEARGEV